MKKVWSCLLVCTVLFLQLFRPGGSVLRAETGAESAAGAEPGASAAFQMVNSWSDGTNTFYQYDVYVTNRDRQQITDWTLDVEVPEGTQVSQFWNCTWTQEGRMLTITPADYARVLEAGATSQGIGLIVTSADSAPWSAYTVRYALADGTQESVSGEGQTDPGQASVQGEAQTSTAESVQNTEENADAPGTGTNSNSADTREGQEEMNSVQTIRAENDKAVSPLHVEGTRLVDESGTPVRLQGVSTHGLGVFPEYVNEDAFRTLRDDFGANVMRLALYTQVENGYCDGDDARRAQQEALIDKGVQACVKLGMYVIIDWHILSDGNPQQHQEEAIDFFRRMSGQYADVPNVIYEICNEPNGSSWSGQIKPYAEAVIPVIRGQAPDSLVLVGTNTWSQDVNEPAADPLAFENVMYTLHFYAGTHKDDLRSKLTQALDAGAPVFISECSICDASGNGGIDYDSAQAWKQLIKERGLSVIEWNLSNKAETSAMVVPGCSKVSDWSTDELTQTALWYREMMRELAGLE